MLRSDNRENQALVKAKRVKSLRITGKVMYFLLAFSLSCAASQREPEKLGQLDHKDSIQTEENQSIGLRDSLVEFGMKYMGTPYARAGQSPRGFDCSGFVYFVFSNFDIQVPRSSKGYANFGTEIPIDSVKKGDVLVFLSPSKNVIGHVGLVSKPSGKATEFLHASSGKRKQVIETSLSSKSYTRRFVKAVRIVD